MRLNHQSKGIRCPRTPIGRFVIVLAAFSTIALFAALVQILSYFGVFTKTCDSGPTGLICNGQGTCDRGTCICDNAYYSGKVCSENLIDGLIATKGLECNGNGEVGSPFMSTSLLAPACREIVTEGIGSFKKTGGWGTDECLQDTAERRKRIDTGNATLYDLFAVPVCQCEEGFGGSACNENPCPKNIDFLVCAKAGNVSVGYTSNYTNTGLGCQCNQPIINYLSRTLRSSFSVDRIREMRADPKLMQRVSKPRCGTLYQHPEDAGVMMVYTRPTSSTYSCFCQEGSFGIACEFGLCATDANGNICGSNGNPDYGFGAQRNSIVKLSPKSKTVCSEPDTVNCMDVDVGLKRDMCVPNTKLCELDDLECPKDRPIRCRDGLCVSDPRRNIRRTAAFGVFENLTDILDDTICTYRTFRDPTLFLNAYEYQLALENCAGDEGVFDNNTGVFIPKGVRIFDTSSLEVVMIETIGIGGYLTVTYRDETYTYTENSAHGQVHYFVFGETYEQEQFRLFNPLEEKRTVTLRTIDEVDIVPSPFLYDDDVNIPPEWAKLRITSEKSATMAFILDSSRTRIEYNETGEWFIANISASGQIVIPGGLIVTIDQCIDEFKKCIWNSETRLSIDGVRKLCNAHTSSTDLECTAAPITNFKRLSVVLTATSDTLPDIDWEDLGPWYVGPAVVGMTDEDFSLDGQDGLLFNPSNDFIGLRHISYIRLEDLVKHGACQPTVVNASTLNTKWWSETIRQSSRLQPGSLALGTASYFGLPKLIRGTVVTDTLLLVNGYDDPVPVSAVKQITSVEASRGLPHESFRVFPYMCPDGKPSKFKTDILENVPVECQCTLSIGRAMTCTCSDYVKPTYRCDCTAIVPLVNSTADACVCNDGAEAGFRQLETQLDEFRRNLQSICYLGSTPTEHIGSGELTHIPLDITPANNTGELYIERTGEAIYLVEFRVTDACINLTDNGSVSIGVQASATLFSDVVETFEVESICTEVNGTMYQVIKPIYDTLKADSYDQWWLTGLATDINFTVVPVFVPRGIPAIVSSVEVSSNPQYKDNVLSNSLSYWHSANDDPKPTVTLWFDNPELIVGIFFVFETVGLNTNTEVILPVELYVQATTDRLIWKTIGTVSSDTYSGNEDYWFAVSTATQYVGFRVRSSMYLAVREMLVMTNQRCDNSLVRLNPESGFESIASTVLTDILDRRLNDSELCVGFDTCQIHGKTPRPGIDDCVDEKYSIEGLGLPATAFVKESTINVTGMYLFMEGIVADENGTLNYSSAHPTTYQFTDEPAFKAWWINDSFVPTDLSLLDYNQSENLKKYNDGYFYRIVDVTRERLDKVLNDSFGFPQYDWFKSKTLVERGIACVTGTHVSACGPSNRLDPKSPGLVCELTAYQQSVLDDYNNRSDHIIESSAVLDEFLDTGRVRVIVDNAPFTRNVAILTGKNCGNCDGLYPCTTGECVQTPDECPVPRYDSPGNGCTREGTTRNKYRCVCKVGTGGSDCSLTFCTPGDPLTGKVNPHAWCSCGQEPPICYQPGAALYAPTKGYLVDEEILVLNRGGLPRQNASDVRMLKVGYSFAPFCIRFLRGYKVAGRIIRTNCPYSVKGPFGQKLTLDDCVLRRNPITGFAEEWVSWPLGNGSFVQYIWKNETHYNHHGYRCPNSYSCEAQESDCYNLDLIRPPCGDGGKCRVDGTCDCYQGKTTFTYTQEWTNLSMVPYNALNPTEWNNGEKPWMFKSHCQAKDCSDGQCELVPYGCYSGTGAKQFRDRDVICQAESGHLGMCASDFQSCDRGEVTEPLECFGNGYAIKVDGRDEIVCRCGNLKTRLASFADGGNVTRGREQTEIEPNGWGGEYCQHYNCQDDPRKLHWVYVDEKTRKPFIDFEGYTLPGKYVGGSCGAVIGPDPDQQVLWQNYCPGVVYLERCTKVLCEIAKKPTGVPPEQCTGEERTPLVYRCNRKGIALADGTCQCNGDPTTGIGYAGRFMGDKGCYRRYACPISRTTGTPCNRKTNRFNEYIEFPYQPYFDDQVFTALLRRGLPPTEEQVVRMIVKQPAKLRQLHRSAWTQLALGLQRDESDAAGSICVFPNDTSSNPIGMFPYVGLEDSIGPYLKAFRFPYDVTSLTSGLHPILTDLFYQQNESSHSVPPQLGSEYVLTNTSLTAVFSNATFITHVRLYAFNPYNQSVGFRFSSEANVSVCGESFALTLTSQQGQWSWLTAECQQVWGAYDFTVQGNFYIIACLGGTRASQCTSWKDSVCGTIAGAQVQGPDSVTDYPGCPKSERCCVPVTESSSAVSVLKIETTLPIYVQEVTIMGYTSTVLPMPTGLLTEIRWLQGNVSSETPHNGGQAIDDLYLMSEDMLSFDGTILTHRTFHPTIQGKSAEVSTHTYQTALDSCKLGGGHLTMSTGTEDNTNFARTYGAACCKDNSTQTGPVCSKKCLVSAKNRNEMANPTLDDFIYQPCYTNGCFIRLDGTTDIPLVTDDILIRKEYYSCADGTGNMWKYNWANATLPNQLTWAAIFDLLMTEWQRQSEMIGYRTNIPTIRIHNSDVGLIPTAQINKYGPTILYEPFKYWDSQFRMSVLMNAYFTPTDNSVIGNLATTPRLRRKPLTFVTPTGSTTKSYWTSATTCKITLYNYDHCGMFRHGSAAGTKFKGAKTTYFVTPQNDYSILGKNIMNESPGPMDEYYWKVGNGGTPRIWNECADYGSSDCVGKGLSYDNRENQIRSISVEGPCFVHVHGSMIDDKPSYGNGASESDRFYNEEPIFNPVGHRNDEYGREGASTPYGCFLGCYADMRCAWAKHAGGNVEKVYEGTDPGSALVWTAKEVGHNLASTGDVYEYNYWISQTRQQIINYVKIYPLFTSYKVETNFRAERNPVTLSNTGTCHMFWSTHAYMCMRVEVRVLDSVKALVFKVNANDYINQVFSYSKDNRVNASRSMLKVEPVLFNTATGLLTTAHVQQMLTNGGNQRLTSVFVPCNEMLGREVRECPSCMVEQPIGKWEFDPRKYFAARPRTWFLTEKLTTMRQTYTGTIPARPRPEVHINYDSFFSPGTGPKIWFLSLASRRYIQTRFYGGLIAALKLVDYRVKFALDNCVVVRATDRPPNVLFPTVEYMFDTAVCMNPLHHALCTRDHTKHACMRGRQCDISGTSTRIGGFPNGPRTVFDEFPKINPAAFPALHRALAAFLAGRIDDFVEEADLDYKEIYRYLRETTTTSLIVAAFSIDYLMPNGCDSDRPGHLSDSVTVGNPVSWLDFCIPNIWPIDCGLRCSKESGICRKRRAVESRYCDPDAEQFEVTEIPDSERPLGLLPVTDAEPFKVPRCGTKIDPVPYGEADSFGFPSSSTKAFVILEELPGDSVWLRITKEGRSSWQNTGKTNHEFIFRNSTVLYGQFKCNKRCTIGVWVSGLSPSYSADPGDKQELGVYESITGDLTSFTINLVDYLNDTAYYRSLGWDVFNLTRGDTVRLYTILASNPESIYTCQHPTKWPIRQPSSFFEYSEPENICPDKYQFHPLTGAIVEPGQCLCLDASFGGEKCEAPAIISFLRNAHGVCGLFGFPGFMALDNYGNKVPVNQDGSWESVVSGTWGCKTINPGLIIRTRLFPATRFDFPFIYLTQSIVGQTEFSIVERLTDTNDQDGDDEIDELVPLTYSGTGLTCVSESATLPSYYTADEVAKFLRIAEGQTVFVDMAYAPYQYFKWADRSTEIARCKTVVNFDGTVDEPGDCGIPVPVTPCTVPTSDGCTAIQFNNFAFDSTPTNDATDGLSTTKLAVTSGGTATIPLATALVGMGTVKLFLDTPGTVSTVYVTLPLPVTQCTVSTVPSSHDFFCNVTGITEVEVHASLDGAMIRELHVYNSTDELRFWNFHV